MGYLDDVIDSARDHPYVLKDTRNGPPQDTVHAVCLKRPCLLSASLSGSLDRHAHKVGIAKDLLSTASKPSTAIETLEHVLSRAVDADPTTYFESKQGSSSEYLFSSPV